MLEFIPRHLINSGSDPKDLLNFLLNQNFQLSYINQEKKIVESVSDPNKLLTYYDDGKNLFCRKM